MNLNYFSNLLKNKQVLLFGFAVLLATAFLFVIIAFNLQKKESTPYQLPDTKITGSAQIQIEATPTVSAMLQLAMDEAKQSAREYDEWQANLRLSHSWLRKLPLADTSYYVYFDLSKDEFIARLYPKQTESVEMLKKVILNRLVNEKGIPVENYYIEWQVNPK